MILQETDQSHLEEDHAMTYRNFIDPEKFLSDQLAAASPDLLRSREMIRTCGSREDVPSRMMICKESEF